MRGSRSYSYSENSLAAAGQRYDYIEMTRTDTEQGLVLDLTNFHDEAWFLLRLNDAQQIAEVSGGEITQLNDTLYLICASAERVEIRFA